MLLFSGEPIHFLLHGCEVLRLCLLCHIRRSPRSARAACFGWQAVVLRSLPKLSASTAVTQVTHFVFACLNLKRSNLVVCLMSRCGAALCLALRSLHQLLLFPFYIMTAHRRQKVEGMAGDCAHETCCTRMRHKVGCVARTISRTCMAETLHRRERSHWQGELGLYIQSAA